MKSYKVKYLSDNVAIRYDLTCWTLFLQVIHWWNPQFNCKDTQIHILCFSIRFLHRKGVKYDKLR